MPEAVKNWIIEHSYLRVNQIHQPVHLKPLKLANNGEMAEQLVGQLLRRNFQFYQDPVLYYWQREGQSMQKLIMSFNIAIKLFPLK
jgi:hypothetical protein